jgi:hypothetical protein
MATLPTGLQAEERISLSMEAQIDHKGILAFRLNLFRGEQSDGRVWRMYDLLWKPGRVIELPYQFDPRQVVSKSSDITSADISGLLGEGSGSLVSRVTEFFISSVNSACTQAALPSFCTQIEPMNRYNFEQYMRGYLTALAGKDPITKTCLRFAGQLVGKAFVCLEVGDLASSTYGDFRDHPENAHRYVIRRIAASFLAGDLDPGGNYIAPWEDEEPACWCVYHWRFSIEKGKADKLCRTLHTSINRCGGVGCHCEIPEGEKCPPEEPGNRFNGHVEQEVVEKIECGAACYSHPRADQLRKCGESFDQDFYKCCTINQECYTLNGAPKCGPYCPQAFFQCGAKCCQKNEFCDKPVESDPTTWQCKPAAPAPMLPGIEPRHDIAE